MILILSFLHAPDTDDVVSVTSEEGLTVRGPGKRDTLGVGGGTRGEVGREVGDVVLVKVGDGALGVEVPDLDGRTGTGAKPVTVGGEDEGVDDVSSVKRAKVLALVQVPQHGDTVLATRGAEGTVRGNSDGVDVAGVSGQVSNQLAVLEVPDLLRREGKRGRGEKRKERERGEKGEKKKVRRGKIGKKCRS